MSKIIRLEAQNVKRIKAVSIEPTGAAVVVGGRNAQGKSSVLDAIEYALLGGRALPERPIRDGEKVAQVVCELDGLTVRRVIGVNGASLVVTGADGERVASPQKVLDRMVGAISFDPLEFVRADARTQVKTLAGVLGVPVEALDQQRKDLYERRTQVNRALKSYEATAATAVPEPIAVPSSADLIDELERAQAAARAVEDARREVMGAHGYLVQCGVDVNAAQAKVEQLERELAQAVRDLDAERAELARAQERKAAAEQAEAATQAASAEQRAVEAIRADLTEHAGLTASAAQQQVAWQAWRDSVLRRDQHATAAELLTQEIADLDAERARLVADGVARIGLAGLDVAETGVTFHGVPVKQASSAEQLRVAVGIGLAANPEIRVILIREGALLDDQALAEVVAMAAAADAQVWVERVGDGAECSVIIEDGEVQEVRP